jgi:hypothetical protein
VILVVFFFAFAKWSGVTAPTHKKLDYAKPIITSDGAIVCPQALFYDMRADHGPKAVYEAFGAFTHRADKAHALGCEVVTGGIPVTAHRMTHPLEDFVSVTFPGNSASELFTMEAELENPEGAVPTQTFEETTEGARAEFQRAFPSLSKTRTNLRWFEDQIEAGADAQEFASLVTPYGPCIEFAGNTSAGYDLLFVGTSFANPHGKPTMLGGQYGNRLEAIHAAEDYCHRWYLSERSKPPNLARDSQMWFTPEEEETIPPPTETPATIVQSTVPDDTVTNQPPAPIVRQPTPQD